MSLEPETEYEPSEDLPPQPPRRRWPWLLLILAALIYAAPWLLSINGVAQQVTAKALPWLPPGSNLGRPTLNWISPVQLAGLRILDEDGRVILECDHVTSQKSLWEMATNPHSPGGWVLEKPKALVRLDPTGLSLNPVIRKFLARKKSTRPLDFDVTIDEGTIEFLDPQNHRLATIADVAAKYANSATNRSLEGRGNLNDGETKGAVEVRGNWDASNADELLPAASVQGVVSYLPLTLFKPWLEENSTIDEITGGGEVVLSLTSDTRAVSGKMSFTPKDARYRRSGDHSLQPVPSADVSLISRWDPAADRLTFDAINLTAGLVRLNGKGMIDQPGAAGVIDLKTVADQDMSGILDLLNPEIRQHIVVNGLRVRNVVATGALWPERFAARSSGEQSPPPATLAGDITWTDAVLYGVHATPGAVTAALQPDGIALWPRDVRVGEGQLVTLPNVQLVDNRQLVAPQGPMLIDVNMTPEMCREWLKFVSPVLADATAVEGKLTLIIELGQMPLKQPDAAEIKGVVRLQSAKVTPGPLAQRAIESAGAVARLITQRPLEWADRIPEIQLPPQDIEFRLHDGRVYHKGMQFRAGDIVVMTRGSVGLDHTLDMLVEIPLPDAWLDRGPVLRSLKGEVVTIPLQGTLEKPIVDGRALAEWGKKLGVGAASGLLQNLLENGLERAAERGQRRRERRNVP